MTPFDVTRSSLRRALSRSSHALPLLMFLGTTPLVARAQVGHLPDRSPYEDVKPSQTVSLYGGRLGVKRDPANVAPNASLFYGLRYDLPIGGPAAFYTRYEFAPSQRNLFDPTKPGATRKVSTPSVTTHLVDLGLDVSLTGRKTWRHLMPSVNGGVGIVSDFAGLDTGSYKFGTKFSFAYGASLRYLLRSGWALRADATNHIWQYQYPDRYFVKASDTTSILVDTRARSAWRGNWALSAGMSIPIFR